MKIVPPALIHIKLNDPTVAAWLDSLTKDNGEEENSSLSPSSYLLENKSKLLFTIQYAHARCCSLLRLADREGLIQLVDHGVDDRCFMSAQSISWLNSEQKLRLNQADEVHLIHQLVKIVDDLVFPDFDNSVNWEKSALKLSQAWESFWSNCRIWGDVKNNSRELAQARLGLLIATQLVLRSVLETKLGVFAPLEL
ncbi:DALR anticodon-binding domain-containing protein [Anabaena cylindrica UHCC 0172]|uniref:DALR anticodon-binding domain-containing protein n=1 Tax=Anabaena cylindrica TaxID=1165 RepID=UPI002B210554|nr:DALR anticodon-binding domain-containing protein [Anabaena cylindrica]MEA5549649.1 DALR anticodon-binding domain-containing protein [Anabaena cylindrica UHCC 0172]